MSHLLSQWMAAGAPRDPVVHINMQLTVASRQGRAQVASCGTPPIVRQSQSEPASQHAADRQPPRAGYQGPGRQPASLPQNIIRPVAAGRNEAEARASRLFAEDEQNRAIARFRPFIRVAAISATRPPGPDHYGLGRHLAGAARDDRSPEERPGESTHDSR